MTRRPGARRHRRPSPGGWRLQRVALALAVSAAVALATALVCVDGRAMAAEAIRLGMSAPFSGPSRGLGFEYYRGVQAFLEPLNAAGGVNGRRIQLLCLDDGYSPLPTLRNTIRLVEQEDVFALFGYVGTPTITRMLPLLTLYKRRHLTLFFPLTGAEATRKPPHGEHVYNLRASYAEETWQLVRHFLELGLERIAVFHQADSFGRSGWEGVRDALSGHGLTMRGEASYRRGALVEDDYLPAARRILAARPQAVIVVGTSGPAAGFIRDLRRTGFDGPVGALSFVDVDNLLTHLLLLGKQRGEDFTQGLVGAQVLPSYEDLSLPAVREYRGRMDALVAPTPPGVPEQGYMPHRHSMVSLEGFLAAKTMAEALRRLGDELDPARLPRVMEEMDDFDLGIGARLAFGVGSHQGLRAVYFITMRQGRLAPLHDWAAFWPRRP